MGAAVHWEGHPLLLCCASTKSVHENLILFLFMCGERKGQRGGHGRAAGLSSNPVGWVTAQLSASLPQFRVSSLIAWPARQRVDFPLGPCHLRPQRFLTPWLLWPCTLTQCRVISRPALLHGSESQGLWFCRPLFHPTHL